MVVRHGRVKDSRRVGMSKGNAHPNPTAVCVAKRPAVVILRVMDRCGSANSGDSS
jgi:hypothetical protein